MLEGGRPRRAAGAGLQAPRRLESRRGGARRWPNYQMCLEGAPKGSSGNRQRTVADFTWCMIAIDWGHSVKATAARLMEESTKARENGQAYAMETAVNAAAAVERRRVQEGQGRPLAKGVSTPTPLSDLSAPLVFPRNFNRFSGPDANSCTGCHNARSRAAAT